MPRPEKVQAVATIKERIENAQAVFLAEYAGLSVKEQQQLRSILKKLRDKMVQELHIEPEKPAAYADKPVPVKW